MSTMTLMLGSGGRVLVVDDDAGSRLLARSALELGGMMVFEAADGVEALERFEELAPDVVVMDVEMPRMNGYDACAAIRARPEGRRTPIMMLTGQGDIASVNRAFDAGATDFIAKPVSWALLGHKVAYLFRASRMRGELARSEERQTAVLAAVPDVLLELDESNEVLQVFGAQQGNALLGSSELVGRSILTLLPPDAAPQFAMLMQAARRKEPHAEFEFELATSLSGAVVEARAVPYRENGILLMLRDVTERRRSLERIRELAFFDALTSLPNVEFFRERVAVAAANHRATGAPMAILHVDLDHFQRINDSFGQKVGDGVLRAVAQLLRRAFEPLSSSAFVARFGGDQFSVLLPDVINLADAEAQAERVSAAFTEPLTVDGLEVFVTAAIGVAAAPEHGSDEEALTRNAHAAAGAAKLAGGHRVQTYSSALERSSRARLELAADLRRAVEAGGLALAFQPQVDLKQRRLAGFEVLVRWQHPQRGWISPAEFIPIAEESSLIVALSEWVLDAALQQLQAWRLSRYAVPRIAVNLSSAHFSRADVAQWVAARLQRFALPATVLELEITEGLLMRDTSQTHTALAGLKALGVRLALDDFGTGYSALSYLKRFSMDALKIDRSFVSDLGTDPGDAAICSAIIAMAHRLGLEVIAEGVENATQLSFLRGEGCDMAQGFLLGRPMLQDKAEEFLRNLAGQSARSDEERMQATTR
jgi:diguanylate cyclase (GGDEF)-like protein/PAS domain S-box-containing protein